MSTIFDNPEVTANPNLKPANPFRGAGARELAAEFGRLYPIGAELTTQEFDEYSVAFLGVAPAASTEKGSDGWLAFLQRRHQAKSNLNNAACHPDLLVQHGVTPYFIRQNGANLLSVVSPADAATKTGKDSIMYQLATLTDTKQRRLRYLIQSVDFENLPSGEQVNVAMLAEHIEDFKTRIDREIEDLDRKFNRVRSTIKRLVSDGHIRPQNGGILALTDDAQSSLQLHEDN